MEEYRKIRIEDVRDIISKKGYYYISTEKLYDENFTGARLLIVTDDPEFKIKHPKYAEMEIITVDKFEKMIPVINTFVRNEGKEHDRMRKLHNLEGYYEDCNEDDSDNGRYLKIFDLDMNPVEDMVERNMLREMILIAISQLTEIQQRRVKLYFYDRYTEREIAEIEGVSYKQIKKSLDQAKNKIRKNFLKRGLKIIF